VVNSNLFISFYKKLIFRYLFTITFSLWHIIEYINETLYDEKWVYTFFIQNKYNELINRYLRMILH